MLRIILPLTLSLFILMFAYNAIEAILPLETYGTDFYGYATLSLALIYLSMTVFNLFAGYLVSIKPAGTLILLGPLGYGAFSLAVAGKNEHLWLATAVFLGITASIYWICIRALVFREVDRKWWGKAFGVIAFVATLGGGLGPYVLLRALHSLSDIAGAAFLLSLMAALPLLLISGRGGAQKFKRSFELGIFKNGLFLSYLLLSLALSVYLPFVIVAVPAIAGSSELLGEYRLLSYALPSTLSLIGGVVYDRYKAVLPILLLPPALSALLIERNLLLLGFMLTAFISLASPGLQAMLGELVPKKELGIALGTAAFAAGLGTSLNIYLLGHVISAYGIFSALVYTAMNILAGACAAGYIIGASRRWRGLHGC